MKILVIGDNHFNRKSRWNECLRIHDWFAEQVETIRPDVVAYLGDMYEGNSSPEERLQVSGHLQRVADVAPVIVLAGNHERLRDVALFRKIASRHQILVEEEFGIAKIQDAAFGTVAWPREVPADAISVDGVAASIHDAVRARLEEIGEQMQDHPGPRILLGHLMPDGATMSSGQPSQGRDANVTWDDFALANVDVVLLGHIHRAAERTVDGVPILNVGSPYRNDFGEAEPKSVVLLETSGREIKIERIPTPATPMVLLEGELKGEKLEVWYDKAGIKDVLDLSGAEVRLRYLYDRERRGEAYRMASAWMEAVLGPLGDRPGAVSVDLRPIPQVRSTARAPEVATAQTLVEKVQILWQNRGLTPPPEGRLTDFIRLLDEAEGGSAQAVGGAFKFERLEMQGFLCYPEKIVFDLTALDPAKTIAIVGPNGSGKSILLGMLLAAITRECPGRGPLAELAIARDAYLEVRFVCGGARHSIRQMVDSKTGLGKTIIYDADHEPIKKGETSVTAGDAWIQANLPPPEVVLASTFAAQADSGLLDMSEGDRTKVFLRAIGIERVERMAKGARDRAAAASREVETLTARIKDEIARGGDPIALQEQLASAKSQAFSADEALATARQMLADAEAASRDEAEALRHYERQVASHRDLQARHAGVAKDLEAKRSEEARLGTQLVEINRSIAEVNAVLAREEEITKAVAADQELAEQARVADLAGAEIAGEIQSLAAVERQATSSIVAADASRSLLGLRIERATKVLAERPMVDEAVARLPGLTEARRAAAEARGELVKRLEVARGKRLATATDRIQGLRGGLELIAGEGLEPASIAKDTLTADDKAVKDAKDAPQEVQKLEEEMIAAMTEEDRCGTALHYADVQAARVAEMDRATEDLEAARAELETANKVKEETQAAKAENDVKLATARAKRQEHEANLGRIQAGRSALAATVALSGSLAQSKARLGELNPRSQDVIRAVGTVRQEIQSLEASERALAESAAAANPGTKPEAKDLAPIRDRASAAEAGARAAHSQVAVLEKAAAENQESAFRLQSLEAERADREKDVADWTRVADDLGRNGLQSLEIDAAGPRVSEIANELLLGAHGNRFSVRIATTRPSADKKRQIECCDIMVYDSVEDREKSAKRLSGGQKVVVGEAVALALAVYGCDRSGATDCTITRDEAGAALDADAAIAYVAMLRKVVEMTNADKVLLVSHAPDVQELCDVRVRISNGTLAVA